MLGTKPVFRLCLLAIILAVVFAFWPVTHSEFVDWDDYQCLTQNTHIRSLSAPNLQWMATTGHMAQWQPLAWYCIALQYGMFGGADLAAFSRGMHLTSILLQAIAGILCFLVGRRLLALIDPEKKPGASVARDLAAAAGAIFFAIHPLRVELVGWATAQPYIVALIFCLGTVWCYLRALEATGRTWFAGALLCYALSLLCKPIGVPLVAVLVILDWYPLRRLGGESGWINRRIRSVWLEKLPFVGLALAVMIITPLAKGSAGSAMPLAAHGLVARAAQACYGLVFYIWKTLLPTALSPLYELRLPLVISEPRYLISIVIVLAVLVLLIVFGRRYRGLAASLMAYTLLVLPVLGFFQSGNQEVADRYCYLPSVAFSLLLTTGLFTLWKARAGSAAVTRGAGVILVVLFVVLCGMSRQQCGVWRDSGSLWTCAVSRQEDSSLAQNSYGFILYQRGQVVEAIDRFRTAIDLKADNHVAHENLWNALQSQKRWPELEAAYRAGIELFPSRWQLKRSLGNAVYSQRRYADAIVIYRQALATDPNDPLTHALLGRAFYAATDSAQARVHALRALELDPSSSLGRRVLELMGR